MVETLHIKKALMCKILKAIPNPSRIMKCCAQFQML